MLEAFRGLANTVNDVDTDQLAKSFQVICETFADTPDDVKGALNGLSALSKTISSRDEELSKLLSNTQQISQTLAERDQNWSRSWRTATCCSPSSASARKRSTSSSAAPRTCPSSCRAWSRTTRSSSARSSSQLDQFTGMLQRNQQALANGIASFAPFVRVFTNTIGTGRWFDNYICGLLPPSVGPINPEGCLGATQ